MADPVQVCEAVIERLGPILPEWHWALTEPEPPKFNPLPYGLVQTAPLKGADYVQVNGTWVNWFIEVSLYANGADREASLRKLSPLLGTKGLIHKALKDTMCDYNDSLTKLTNGFVLPTTLSGFKLIRKNKALMRTATIAVAIGSN